MNLFLNAKIKINKAVSLILEIQKFKMHNGLNEVILNSQHQLSVKINHSVF